VSAPLFVAGIVAKCDGLGAGGPGRASRNQRANREFPLGTGALTRIQQLYADRIATDGLGQPSESEARLRLALNAGRLGYREFAPGTRRLLACDVHKEISERSPAEEFTHDMRLGSLHRDDLQGREDAIAEAHNLLTDTGWEAASFRAVTERVLSPYRGDGEPRYISIGNDSGRVGRTSPCPWSWRSTNWLPTLRNMGLYPMRGDG
jgi:hypothetical protein